MNRIVVFLQSIAPEAVTGAFPAHEPLLVRSKSECAQALVSGAAIDCLILQRDAFGPEYRSFLASVRLHFPFLEVVLIAPIGPNPPPEGCHFVDSSNEGSNLTDRVGAFSRAFRKDQRRGIRFDWPLRGRLAAGGPEVACNVRSFSRSGAFLETDVAFQAGSVGALRIEFLNSQIAVPCTCVRRQEAQADQPGGYGVSFRELSIQAHAFFERIVDDAVIQALLYPEQEPQVPTLSDDDLLIPGFEQP